MQSTAHVYEVRPRKDKRGVDLISDALPFGRVRLPDQEAVGCFGDLLNKKIHLDRNCRISFKRNSLRRIFNVGVRLKKAISVFSSLFQIEQQQGQPTEGRKK